MMIQNINFTGHRATRNRSCIRNATRNRSRSRSGSASRTIRNHNTGVVIRTKQTIADEINSEYPKFTEAIINSLNHQMKDILNRMTNEEQVQKIRNDKIFESALQRCIQLLNKTSPIVLYCKTLVLDKEKRIMNLFTEMTKLDNIEKNRYILKKHIVKPWRGGNNTYSIIRYGFLYSYELSKKLWRRLTNEEAPPASAHVIPRFGPKGTVRITGMNDDNITLIDQPVYDLNIFQDPIDPLLDQLNGYGYETKPKPNGSRSRSKNKIVPK